MVQQVHQDRQAQRDQVALREPLEQQARLDHPAQAAQQARRVLQEIRDQPEPQDLTVRLDQRVHKALLGLREQQDRRGRKVWYGKVIGSHPQSTKLMMRSFTP